MAMAMAPLSRHSHSDLIPGLPHYSPQALPQTHLTHCHQQGSQYQITHRSLPAHPLFILQLHATLAAVSNYTYGKMM